MGANPSYTHSLTYETRKAHREHATTQDRGRNQTPNPRGAKCTLHHACRRLRNRKATLQVANLQNIELKVLTKLESRCDQDSLVSEQLQEQVFQLYQLLKFII